MHDVISSKICHSQKTGVTGAFPITQGKGYSVRVSGKFELSEFELKGHSQLMHMRIRYRLLADLHVTRQARETESEKRIQNTLNKPCRVESPNREYRP